MTKQAVTKNIRTRKVLLATHCVIYTVSSSRVMTKPTHTIPTRSLVERGFTTRRKSVTGKNVHTMFKKGYSISYIV